MRRRLVQIAVLSMSALACTIRKALLTALPFPAENDRM